MLYLPTILRRCTRCATFLPATKEFFHRDRKSRDGFTMQCKACISARMAQHYIDHREQKLAYVRQYRKVNYERVIAQKRISSAAYRVAHREQRKAYQRAYHARNSERERLHRERTSEHRRAIARAYYAKNVDKKREQAKNWAKQYPDRANARNHNYRARQRAAPGTHSADDVARQYKSQKGKCYYCGKKVGRKFHVDHVIPLDQGGSNGPENIVIACPQCNHRKRNKRPDQWPEGGKLL